MASQCGNIKGKKISQQTKLARKRNNKLIQEQPSVHINCSKCRIVNRFPKKFTFLLKFLIINALSSIYVDALAIGNSLFILQGGLS